MTLMDFTIGTPGGEVPHAQYNHRHRPGQTGLFHLLAGAAGRVVQRQDLYREAFAT